MMSRRSLQLGGVAPGLFCAASAWASTYYVSPTGNDNNSGTSPGSAWQSLTKVDNTSFAPGSQILFQDGGNWYGNSLSASSDGTASQPIVYGSYGNGPNPTLWGSIPVASTSMLSVSGTTYVYQTTTPINAFFINHQFFHNADMLSGSTSVAVNEAYVMNNPGTAYFVSAGANSGELVNTGFTPQYNTPNINYSAAVQQDVISSNAHSNLVFENFNVRESAAENAGYGIRVEGSSNVQVLNSTVTAAGKHAVGVIDSTGFTGTNISASYLMPDQLYGGATAFAAYADFNVENTTSQWINDSFTNANGPYQAFITHVNNTPTAPTPISNVLVQNLYANTNPAITVITSGSEQVNIVGGQVNGDVQLQGNNTTVNGLLVSGSNASIYVQGGNNNVIENSIINGDTPNWTAARNAAIDVSGSNTIIRNNSIYLGTGSGIYGAAIGLEDGSTNTQLYGNIIDTPYAAFYQNDSGYPSLIAHDNLFAGAVTPEIIYFNRTPADTPVSTLPISISANELYGDAGFADPNDNDFSLTTGSVAAYVFNPATNQYVMYDYYGNVRPSILESLGAIQVPTPGSTGPTWNVDGDGNWENAANWTGNTAPNATDAIALLGPGITAPRTVTISTSQTVGILYFSSPISYTVAGSGTITFNSSGGSSAIDVSAGNHTVSANLTLSDNTAANLAPNSVLTINSFVDGPGTLTASGPGTLLIGTKAAIAVPLLVYGNLSFASNGNTGGILEQQIPSLEIGLASLATLVDPGAHNHSNRTLLVTGALTFDATTGGVLDLNGNDLDVQNGSLSLINSEIASGYNGGNWNGTAGIISSAAAADSTHLTALGVLLNQNGTVRIYGRSTGGLGPFDGTRPLITDVLVKYTWYGDANLDGKVDGSDYARIDNGYLSQLTGWYNGDFNYDGVIDGSDYTLIDNAFNQQGASLAAQAGPAAQPVAQIADVSTVPEPSGILTLSAGLAGMLGRRRRFQ